ncbi:putative serine/threonine-protein kinase [Trifolium repens]|jgi:hypothetical protein|nr:putative serine/threonine-protein kinase [Trifolium repens]
MHIKVSDQMHCTNEYQNMVIMFSEGAVSKKCKHHINIITKEEGLILTLLNIMCILVTKRQSSRLYQHGLGNPTAQRIGKEQSNVQMPIPT